MSRERVGTELDLMLAGANPVLSLDLMVRLGLLRCFAGCPHPLLPVLEAAGQLGPGFLPAPAPASAGAGAAGPWMRVFAGWMSAARKGVCVCVFAERRWKRARVDSLDACSLSGC